MYNARTRTQNSFHLSGGRLQNTPVASAGVTGGYDYPLERDRF